MNRKEFMGTLGFGASAIVATGCRPANSVDTLPDYGSVPDDEFWQAVRQQFPLGADRTYLNSGGLGPAPSCVLEAVRAKTAELQSTSETGYAIMDEARPVAAAFLGADQEEICFTRNATESNSIIAAGLNLQAGDEVIFESHAHPGGSFPWLSRQKREGIRVKIFDPDPDTMSASVEKIRSLITPQTKVIQVSHLTAPTGILFDVKAIAALAAEHGLWFHVDGAQTAGMIPVDVHDMGCDSYSTSGHKWLGGPRGTGIIYIRKDRIYDVACLHAGAHSSTDYELPDQFHFVEGARRHEYGTRNTELVHGLLKAIEFQNAIGKERIEAHGSGLATYLQQRLRELPSIEVLTPSDPAMRRSITTFWTPKIAFNEMTSRLMREHRLRCRQVSERGLNAVRVSTHIYNSKEDCDRVAQAVAAILKTV